MNDGGRSSYFGTFTNFLYGLNSKLNIGFDLYLRSVRLDASESSAFSLFKFENNQSQRTTFSKFGPRVKFVPFKKAERLSIQTTLLFPIAGDLEGRSSNGQKPWLDWDTYTWLTQVFYDKQISSKFQMFTAFETFVRIPRNSYSQQVIFTTPAKIFMTYFPSSKLSLYGMFEAAPTWGSAGNLISSLYTQTGVGGKYQVKSWFEIESLYTIFPIGKNQGAGVTYNFGVRLIR